MIKLLCIAILSLLFAPLSNAQSIQKIHDLKGITDSEGTVHLYYRIMEEFESGFKKNSLYHLNTEIGTDTLFLEDFSNPVVEITERVNELSFFENNPEKYIYTKDECASNCGGFIYRKNTKVFEGFPDIKNLHTTGSDQDTVYVNIAGNVIISDDGGKTWPSDEEIDAVEGDEPFLLDFPLLFLNPFDKNMMFGIDSFNDGSGRVNHFVKTDDSGETSSVLSDSIIPASMSFDQNNNYIYLMDSSDCLTASNNDCVYRFFVSNQKGDSSSWSLKDQFDHSPVLISDPSTEGKVILSQENELFVSYDFGENFELLTTLDAVVTGLYKPEKDSLFISTETSLYVMWNNQLTKLKEIPVSVERTNRNEIAGEIKLFQNYPNPFNPVTNIIYQTRKPGVVRIELYTIHGQLVRELANGYKPEGTHRIHLDGSGLSSGTYIIRARLGAHTQSKTISLIK